MVAGDGGDEEEDGDRDRLKEVRMVNWGKQQSWRR